MNPKISATNGNYDNNSGMAHICRRPLNPPVFCNKKKTPMNEFSSQLIYRPQR